MKFRDDLPEPDTGKFLKLKDGESVAGVFRGEPYIFYNKWVNGKTQLVEEGCPDGKMRFRLNFVVNEPTGLVVKIFENGRTVYDQLKEINDEYDLEKTIIKISRKGEKLETTYTILPLINKNVDSVLEKINNLELHSLVHEETNNGAGREPLPSEEGAPF